MHSRKTSNTESAVYGDSRWPEANPASWQDECGTEGYQGGLS